MPKRKKSQATSKNPKKAMKLPIPPGTPTADDSISNLNDDCLLNILKYLSIADRLQLETVCKRLRDVCKMASRDLKILDFSSSQQKTSDFYQLPLKLRTNQGIGMILKKFGRYVEKLKLEHPCEFNILPIVGQHCSNLTHLEINFAGYKKSYAKYFPLLPKLKYFDICNIKCYPREVFQSLPSDTLTEIHLWTHNRGTVNYLAENGSVTLIAPKAIENFTKLTAISLNGFGLSAKMSEVISKKSNLKYLSLEDSYCRGGLPPLTALRKLEHLNVGLNWEPDETFLKEISESCKNLKSLNLRDCPAIFDQGIKSLGDLLQLEKLVLSKVHTIRGTYLWTLHNLKRLDCHRCPNICDDPIIKFMRNAIKLEYLDVRHSKVTSAVLEVADLISRQRNTILHIAVNHSVYSTWDKPDAHPLLVISGEGDVDLFI